MNLASLRLSAREVIKVFVNIDFWFIVLNCSSRDLSELSRMNALQTSLYSCMQAKEFGLIPNCVSIFLVGPFTAFPSINGLTDTTFFLFLLKIAFNSAISIIGLILANGFEGAMIINVASAIAFFASFVTLALFIPA